MWRSVPPETPYENDSSRVIPAGLGVLHIHAVRHEYARHMNSFLCCTQCSNYIQNLTWTISCPEFCHMKHRSWTESSKTTVLRFMRVYFPYCEEVFPLMTYSSLHSDEVGFSENTCLFIYFWRRVQAAALEAAGFAGGKKKQRLCGTSVELKSILGRCVLTAHCGGQKARFIFPTKTALFVNWWCKHSPILQHHIIMEVLHALL